MFQSMNNSNQEIKFKKIKSLQISDENLKVDYVSLIKIQEL